MTALAGLGLAGVVMLPVACGDETTPANGEGVPADTAGGATAPDDDPSATAPTGEGREEMVAADLFERVNDERRQRDLEPVEWDDRLAQLAEEWSVEMVDLGLEHRDLDVSIFEDRLEGFIGVGENIFTASRAVPAGRAHLGWMESPGHRANILDPAWNRMGIGVHCAEDGAMFATQNFGRTADLGNVDTTDDRTPPPEDPIARPETDGPSC